MEAINCLLILLSVTLYSQQRADNSTIYRLVMQGRYAIHAPLLIKTLLQHFIEQKKAPAGLYGNSGGNSIVLGFAGIYLHNLSIGNTICSNFSGIMVTHNVQQKI